MVQAGVYLILTVFLLLLLVASQATVRFLPQLPLPLLQFGIGALASLPVTGCARIDANDKI